jgi:hypothetical protein
MGQFWDSAVKKFSVLGREFDAFLRGRRRASPCMSAPNADRWIHVRSNDASLKNRQPAQCDSEAVHRASRTIAAMTQGARHMQDMPQTFFRTIDLEDSAQVAKLCHMYQCTEQELEEAVRMVGPMQFSVEQWIRGLSSN